MEYIDEKAGLFEQSLYERKMRGSLLPFEEMQCGFR